MQVMQVVRHRPAPPLDRYVQCFWWSQRDALQDYCEHILPCGRVQLVFALHEAPILCWPGSSSQRKIEWSGSVVHGPQWSYYRAGPKPPGAVAGVAFRPGAAAAVLGLPMAELADQHVPLSTLWGRCGLDLQERLLAAAGPAEVFSILEEKLAARIHRPLLVHPAVAHALTALSPSGSAVRIADLQRAAGCSPRHFIQLFRAAVGLTPKHYHRVQRLNGALRLLASGGSRGLAGIAAAAGYADQAHFNREFRELAGITPTQYRPGRPQSLLHHRAAEGR
jgi:AraC-like DNA-binding protein